MGVGMNQIVFTYLLYLAVSVTLTVWVARKWRRNGRAFLVDVFHGNESLADSVSQLLAAGFYLINLGYVSLALKLNYDVADVQGAIEALSRKVGTVLVALGGMHFFNLYVLSRIRRRSAQACALKPFPDGSTIIPEPDGAGREPLRSTTGEIDLRRFSDRRVAYGGKRR
jgi:hypothetical protein